MEFINDNLWIIIVSILAFVAYTKVWNLTKRVDALEKSSTRSNDVWINWQVEEAIHHSPGFNGWMGEVSADGGAYGGTQHQPGAPPLQQIGTPSIGMYY